MRVIADKLVFSGIDGEAEYHEQGRGGLGWINTNPSMKSAGDRKPSVLPQPGQGEPALGSHTPQSSRFPAPGTSLFSPGKLPLASWLCNQAGAIRSDEPGWNGPGGKQTPGEQPRMAPSLAWQSRSPDSTAAPAGLHCVLAPVHRYQEGGSP